MSTQNKLLAVIASAVVLIALHFVWHDGVVIFRLTERKIASVADWLMLKHPAWLGWGFLMLLISASPILSRWLQNRFPTLKAISEFLNRDFSLPRWKKSGAGKHQP